MALTVLNDLTSITTFLKCSSVFLQFFQQGSYFNNLITFTWKNLEQISDNFGWTLIPLSSL